MLYRYSNATATVILICTYYFETYNIVCEVTRRVRTFSAQPDVAIASVYATKGVRCSKEVKK